jgi:hypothetical protein
VTLFEPIFDALEQADVRYVSVGGVAVVPHGHARLTADLDLAVDLAPRAAAAAIDALTAIGLRPRLPVDASGFADPDVRRRWITDRGMTVFSIWDPDDPLRSVDLFVEHQIDFEGLWSRSQVFDIAGTPVRVAAIDDLIHMKRVAGRPGRSRGHRGARGDPGAGGRSMTAGTDPTPRDGWEAHRLAELEGDLTATPAQRLIWLERAIAFAFETGALPRPAVDEGSSRND